jgi:general secretion pathway protein C
METLFGKYLGAVDLVVVALCAIFAAHAADTALDSEVSQLAPATDMRPRLCGVLAPTIIWTKEVDAILNRNVFFSAPRSLPQPGERTMQNLKLLAVMFAPPPADPRWSIAIIRDDDARSAGPYVVGSRLRRTTISEIDEARVYLETDSGRREHIDLLEHSAPATRAVPATDAGRGIKKTGEHRYEVERTTLDLWLGNLGSFVTEMRVVPETKGGRAAGFRLLNIRPDSPLTHAGLQNGDVILAINNIEMNTPDQALAAYMKLKTASHLAVELERNGQRITQDYDLR